ncbi:MAG TPA: branched-chain amino acid ABC transporter substrate-binding protein [Solirubrobacteraceae bacterium]|nr:branched-chain amino acid ABC transporter substrate-binding protein [Solirubrobacteraceae bacterium]
MLARGLGLVALAAALLGLVGCGGVAVSDVAEATAGHLTVYSSLPLHGPAAAASEQIVDGEKLALADAGGRVGPYKIDYASLNDASPTTGQWEPGMTEVNAKVAAQDTSTIAYLGDFDSGATAVSLPLINAAGILQISPASPYVGLTSPLDAGQDEPERFYPSARRTFVRLAGGDVAQAQAQVALMRSLGVKRMYVLDDQDPFQVPLANLVAEDAQRAGIAVLAHDSIPTVAGSVFTGEVEKVASSHAQALFLAGGEGAGTATLWDELHAAAPRMLLLGASSPLDEAFSSHIDAGAAAVTYLTAPVLPVALYPPSAGATLARYRGVFGRSASAYALYGYEAMNLVLDAIRRAGARATDRQTVIEEVLHTTARNSVLGRYSIDADGEVTPVRFAVERPHDGRLAFDRAIEVRGTEG